jgi:cytochrome c biogenesis protein CcdA
MPLVQAARNKREWLTTILVLSIASILVAALFGALLGAPTSWLAGLVGSRRAMSQVMQTTLVASGVLSMAVGMGELGLIRRLLPELHIASTSPVGPRDTSAGGLYRAAAVLGATMTATFGLCCTQPLYLVLLVYVAVVGNILFGALALGAYGLGLVASVALSGLILLPAGRAARLIAWRGAHQEAFHLVQGLVFAGLGSLTVAFFWLRYVVPPS